MTVTDFIYSFKWFLPLFFLVAWVLVSYGVAWWGGWRALAQRYRTDSVKGEAFGLSRPPSVIGINGFFGLDTIGFGGHADNPLKGIVTIIRFKHPRRLWVGSEHIRFFCNRILV